MQELHCRVAILLPNNCEWGANLIHSKPQWYVVKTHVYTWVERNDMRCSFLSNKTMQCQGQVSNCQPPDLKSEALTLRLFNGKNIRSDLEKICSKKMQLHLIIKSMLMWILLRLYVHKNE